MKQSRCCHATYTKQPHYIFTGSIQYECDKCNRVCTLEDIPVHTEGWEEISENKRKEFAGFCSICNARVFRDDIIDFITQELARQREEMVERMETLFYNMVEDAAVSGHLSMEYLKDIKRLIQEK